MGRPFLATHVFDFWCSEYERLIGRFIMRGDNVNLFRVLDEVSKDGDLTQRTLSQRLGVALGLTNLYLKRLGKKGLIKVVNLKPNRLRYELTPSGVAHKTAMAFQYVQDSYVFYREARKSLTKTFDGIKAVGVRSVALHGTGELAEIALLSLQEAQLVVVGVLGRGDQVGKALCGHPVLPPDVVSSLRYDRIVVADRDGEEAVRVLRGLGVDESKIVKVGI